MASGRDSCCPYKKLRVTELEEKDEETGQPSSTLHVFGSIDIPERVIVAENREEGVPIPSSTASLLMPHPEQADMGEKVKAAVTENVPSAVDRYECYDDCELPGFLDLDKLKSGHEAEIGHKDNAMQGNHEDYLMDDSDKQRNSTEACVDQSGLKLCDVYSNNKGAYCKDNVGELAERMEIPSSIDGQSSPDDHYVHNIQAFAENNYMKTRFSSTNTCTATDALKQSKGDNCIENVATAKGDYPSFSRVKHGSAIADGQSLLKELTKIDNERIGSAANSSQQRAKDSSDYSFTPSSQVSDVRNFPSHTCTGDKNMHMEHVTRQNAKDSHNINLNLEKTDFINMLTLPLTYGHQRTTNTCASQCSSVGQLNQPSTSNSSHDCSGETCSDVRQVGECFKLEQHPADNENSINYLPSSILVQIFSNLKVYDLLRRVNHVCKYWYNLCLDPDLWLSVNLVNQHRLTDTDLKMLIHRAKCRIRTINLADCRFITNEGVKALVQNCPSLQTIKLMRCFYITDAAFNGLVAGQHCSSLKYLYLDGCSYVSDNTVVKIAVCCQLLRCLNLNQCAKVTDTGVMALAQGCPHLRQLQLDHCLRVSNVGLSKLVVGCPELDCLNLMSCGISDVGVKYLSRLSRLRNIDLSNIPRLMPDSVIHVSKCCKNLQCVNVSLNAVISDDCIAELATNLPLLKRLYCVSCNISDRGLEELAKHCKTLEALDVGWCQEITDHGVRVISTSCPHLVYLGLIRCDKITIATIEELAIRFPQINFSTFILESRRLLEMVRSEGYRFEMTAL